MKIVLLRMSLFAIICLIPSQGISSPFDQKTITSQWDVVRDTEEESSFLINIFIKKKMSGIFPETVKSRFQEIATSEDAAVLLKKMIDPTRRSQHTSAKTLLRGLKGDNFTKTFEEFLYIATNRKTRRDLYNFIILQNSLIAFRTIVTYMNYLEKEGRNSESLGCLNGIGVFTSPSLRQELISGTTSTSVITRAASYIALRNYFDNEVLAIIEKAMVEDNGIIPGEDELFIPEHRRSTWESSYIKNILKTTQKELKRGIKSLQQGSYDTQEREKITNPLQLSKVSYVSAGSSDEQLASEYSPQILLSNTGPVGVNLKNSNYPYTDYIPMWVSDVAFWDGPVTAYLNLAEEVWGYGPGNVALNRYYGFSLSEIGYPSLRSSSNFLDFSPAWSSSSVEEVYRNLNPSPLVYFKVFRDFNKENPIAIQYWFFYYYNDWVVDHPGDWETITVFLNSAAQAKEAVFSTHYEANRYSWNEVEKFAGTHPKVYVSNGGHGSYYEPGDTFYGPGIYDNHYGDKEILNHDPEELDGYGLTDLKTKEYSSSHWIWFEGRWGNAGSAPKGPHFRTDMPSTSDWPLANNPPYDPENGCAKRYATNIYGDDENFGPWRWASGYGLDVPWESASDCRRQDVIPIIPFLHILLLENVPST